jgi:hypothetical protein
MSIFLLIATLPLASISQQADAVLSKFFATPLNETVFLRWTITAGNTCQDTYIERSSDGINYERIGIIGGICGSPDQDITYEFTDSLPLVNRETYYRLELGFYGYSSPRIVEFIHFNSEGFLLAPNPFTESTRLAFENKDSEKHELKIFDMQGRIVQVMLTEGNEYFIRRLDMNPGVYYFRVSVKGAILYKGNLVIQ